MKARSRGKNWSERQREKSLKLPESKPKSSVVHRRAPTKSASASISEEIITGFGKGISAPTEIRYYRKTMPALTLRAPRDGHGNITGVVGAALAVMNDRRDRLLLSWPKAADNACINSALSMLEARCGGKLAHGSVCIWPWRVETRYEAGRIHIEPASLAPHSRALAAACDGHADWTETGLAYLDLAMMSLVLSDLKPQERAQYQVRNPSLLELTPVFEPKLIEGRQSATMKRQKQLPAAYDGTSAQFLSRVQRYTRIRQMGGAEVARLARLNDPLCTPFAVFGLPFRPVKEIRHCLDFPRFSTRGIELVIVDLSHRALQGLPKDWKDAFIKLLGILEPMGSQRPGLLVLTDRSYAYRAAFDAFRAAKRFNVIRQGLLQPQTSVLSDVRAPVAATEALPAVDVKVDLKDGSLKELRDRVFRLRNHLRDDKMQAAADAAVGALNFLRRITNLPVGWKESRGIIADLYGTDDEADIRVRDRFFIDGGLADLDTACAMSGSYQVDLKELHRDIRARLEGLEHSTPVSLKLQSLLIGRAKSDPDFMPLEYLLVFSTPESRDLFRLSDLDPDGLVQNVEVRQMRDTLAASRKNGYEIKTVIMVQPTLDALVDVILDPDFPPRLMLLGDAAGARLLVTELGPLCDLPGFEAVQGRVKALIDAIGHTEAMLGEEIGDVELMMPRSMQSLDFTGADGSAYAGRVVRVQTAHGRVPIRYRPNSEILISTPDDLKAFDKKPASKLAPGDEILVLTLALIDLLRQAWSKDPKVLETLRFYHTLVENTCNRLWPLLSSRERARKVIERIRADGHNFPDVEIQNVQRWISVTSHTLDDPKAAPQAPKTPKRFSMFMDALGIPKDMATLYWNAAIRPTRAYRIREGFNMHDQATNFILDPESVIARAGDKIGPDALERIWQAIHANVDAIVSVDIED